ncbi:dna replication complex gins protein psf1, partial [Quercus suber]
MDRYGRKACQLVKEVASGEKGQLTPYNEEGLDVLTTRNADHYGALIHHLSLVCNKRCLMAYVYNRAENIRSLIWKVGPDMVPPKDPYIQVRVLDDIDVVLSDGKTINFARHSMHFLKRTDAEQFISR